MMLVLIKVLFDRIFSDMASCTAWYKGLQGSFHAAWWKDLGLKYTYSNGGWQICYILSKQMLSGAHRLTRFLLGSLRRSLNLSSPGRRSASQISQGDPATEKSKNPIEIVQTNISKLRRFLLQRLRELLVPSFRSRQPAASSPQVGLERKYSTLSTNTKTEKEKMFLCK